MPHINSNVELCTSVMGANVTASAALGMLLTLDVSNVDSAISALVASPFLTLLLRRGNTTKRALYSFNLWTLRVNDSVDLLVLL